jgi:hypothetical protein
LPIRRLKMADVMQSILRKAGQIHSSALLCAVTKTGKMRNSFHNYGSFQQMKCTFLAGYKAARCALCGADINL